eukprot:IDg90t1
MLSTTALTSTDASCTECIDAISTDPSDALPSAKPDTDIALSVTDILNATIFLNAIAAIRADAHSDTAS